MVSSLAIMACLQAQGEGIKPGKFEGRILKTVTLSYLVSLPDDYEANPTKKYPLLFFLHGSGERGSDLEKLKVHGPMKLAAAGKTITGFYSNHKR